MVGCLSLNSYAYNSRSARYLVKTLHKTALFQKDVVRLINGLLTTQTCITLYTLIFKHMLVDGANIETFSINPTIVH